MSQNDSDIAGWPQFSSEVMRQGPGIRKAHMNSLVRLLKEKYGLRHVNVLEIGSWAGASTITWARAIKDFGLTGSVHCVDIWEPYFDLKANDTEIYQKMNQAADNGVIFEEFRRNISAAGVEDIVIPTRGDSKEVLPGLANESYQIIFIDGSHLYNDVLNDIIQAKRLVVDGGIVCGDDLEQTVDVVDQAAHREALASNIDFVADPSTGISYHPGVSQAIADTFGDVSVWDGLWAVQRHAANFEKIEQFDYEPRIPEHLRLSATATPPELVQSGLGFNIIRSRGHYIGCRQLLGAVDFSIPLDVLSKSYADSDLIAATSLEGVLLSICEMRIAELKAEVSSAPVAELLETNFDFNIVQSQGRYVGCRWSLGKIDFAIPLHILSQGYSANDFFVEETREKVLLRMCEVEKARLNQVIARQLETP